MKHFLLIVYLLSVSSLYCMEKKEKHDQMIKNIQQRTQKNCIKEIQRIILTEKDENKSLTSTSKTILEMKERGENMAREIHKNSIRQELKNNKLNKSEAKDLFEVIINKTQLNDPILVNDIIKMKEELLSEYPQRPRIERFNTLNKLILNNKQSSQEPFNIIKYVKRLGIDLNIVVEKKEQIEEPTKPILLPIKNNFIEIDQTKIANQESFNHIKKLYRKDMEYLSSRAIDYGESMDDYLANSAKTMRFYCLLFVEAQGYDVKLMEQKDPDKLKQLLNEAQLELNDSYMK